MITLLVFSPEFRQRSRDECLIVIILFCRRQPIATESMGAGHCVGGLPIAMPAAIMLCPASPGSAASGVGSA
jgi:hypothetical protein